MLASCRNKLTVLQYKSIDRFLYDDNIDALNKILLFSRYRFVGKFRNMHKVFGIGLAEKCVYFKTL